MLLSQTKSKVHRPQNKLTITDKSKYGKHKRGLYRQKHAMPYIRQPPPKTQKKIQTFIQERMTEKTPELRFGVYKKASFSSSLSTSSWLFSLATSSGVFPSIFVSVLHEKINTHHYKRTKHFACLENTGIYYPTWHL